MAEQLLDTLSTEVTLNLAPFTAGVKDLMASMAAVEARMVEFGDRVAFTAASVQTAVSAAVAGLAATATEVGAVTAAIAPVELMMGAMAGSVTALTSSAASVGEFGKAFAGIQEPIDKVKVALADANKNAGELATLDARLKEVAKSAEPLGAMSGTITTFITGLDSLGEVGRKLGNVTRSLGNLTSALDTFNTAGDRLDAARTRLGTLRTAFEELKPAATAIGESVTTFNAVAQSVRALSNSTSHLRGASNRLTVLKDAIGPLAEEVAKLNGKESGDALKALGAGVKSMTENVTKDVHTLAGRIDKIAPSLAGLAAPLTSLAAIDVKTTFKDLVKGLGDLVAMGPKIVTGAAGIQSMATAFGNLPGAITTAVSGLGQLQQLTTTLGTLSTAGTALTPAIVALEDFVKRLGPIGTNPDIQATSDALRGLSRRLTMMGNAAAPLGLLQTNLENFVQSLNALAAGMGTGVNALGRALSGIGRFLEGVAVVPTRKIGRIMGPLGDFVNDFKTLTSGLSGDEMKGIATAGQALGRIGSFMDSVTKFKFNPKAFTDLQVAMSGMFQTMSVGGGQASIFQGGEALRKVSQFINAAGRINPGTIGALVQPVDEFLQKMAAAPAGQALEGAKVLTRYNTALKNMSAVNPGTVLAAARATQQAMAILNTISVNPGAMRAATAMARIGNAMKNMAAGGAGGGGNIGISVGGGLWGIPPAANAARSSLHGLNTTLGGSAVSSNMLSGSLNTLRFSLLGIGAFGVAQFGKLDDALLRTMAHMGDYGQETRRELQSGINEIAGRSTSSPVDLAKGLDVLTSSGMSASMAVNALAIAENFAVASGMSVEDSTRKLTDMMYGLGLATDNVKQQYIDLTRLSDLLVGSAAKAGLSEKQLAEGFTGKFIVAMRAANMEVEDGIALLAAYSRVNPQARGAAGGQQAARFINDIAKASRENTVMWETMLGHSAFDAEKRMLPIGELLEDLQSKLAPHGSQRTAQLIKLGFDEQKTRTNIEMLLETAGTINKLRGEMEGMGGTSDKVAQMMRTSLLAQMKNLWHNAVMIGEVVGERLAPMLYGLAAGVRVTAEAFTKLNPAFQNLTIILLGVTLAGGPVISLLGSMASSLLRLATAPLRLMLSAFQGIAATASGIGNVLLYIVSIPGRVISAFASLGGYLTAPFTMMYRVAATAIRYIETGAATAWTVFMAPFQAVVYLGKAFTVVLERVVSLISKIGEHGFDMLASAVKSLVVGALSISISLVSWMVMLPVITAMLVTVGAAVAAIGTTVAIGVYQLFGAMAGGAAALWAGFKGAAAAAFDWAANEAVGMHGAMRDVWEGAKAGAAEFFKSTVEVMTKLAGFFWNFRENVKVIGDFLGKHWKVVFEDIGKAIVAVIENTAGNVRTVFFGMGKSLVTALTASGASVWNYLASGFLWLEGQWENIVRDMSLLAGVFVDNLSENFQQLLPVIDAIADYLINRMIKDPFLREDKMMESREKDYKKIMKAANLAYGNLNGPFEGVENYKDDKGEIFKTQLIKGEFSLGEFMKTANLGNANLWKAAARDMKADWKDMVGKLNPVLGGFAASPVWEELAKGLNLTLPDDAFKKTIESFAKQLAPPTERDGEMGDAFGKGGPGYQFKQVSQERYMVGGQVAENLDFQQLVTMRNIDAKLGIIIQSRGWPVGRVPVTKD